METRKLNLLLFYECNFTEQSFSGKRDFTKA